METKSIIGVIRAISSNSQKMNAKELAQLLNCSEKTVKNYINEINCDKDIVLLDKEGYYFEPSINVDLLLDKYKYSSAQECQSFIIRRLLTNANGLSIDDTLDELCISDKTLDKYIIEINRQIKGLDLSVGRKNGNLILKGDEKNKKELLKRNLKVNDYSIVEKGLSSYCELVSIDYLLFKKIVSSIFDEYNIHVNDYTFLTILSHLVIKFIRVRGGADIDDVELPDIKISDEDIKCASNIIDKLNATFGVGVPKEEARKLANLIALKSTNKEVAVTNSEYREFVLDVVKKVKDKFGISLRDDEFISFFSLHIINLVKRSKSGMYNENPLFERTLNSDSFIYEIAVFISSELEKKYDISIPDTEIGFLAFHIGSVIVKKNLLSEEINVAVNMFDFYGFGNLLKEALEKYESSYIHFHYIDKNSTIPSYKFDLLITTPFSNNNIVSYNNKITINPMYNKKDLHNIQNKLEEIEENKNRKKANVFISQFFNPLFFEKNIYLDNEDEYIRYISGKLIENGIVDTGFTNSVIDREKYTPTSFENGIAIPHAIEGNAMFNNAYIILNDKPVKWGNYMVNAIIVIALRSDGYTGFRYVLDTLMNKTSNRDDLMKMVVCKDYFELIDYLKY